MASVHLDRADLALIADPGGSRVVIPTLFDVRPAVAYESALVRFDGDDADTSFRGEGVARSYQLVCRFAGDEHPEMASLLALLERAHTEVDGRLQFRTHWGLAPGLNRFEVATVVGPVTTGRAGGHVWDVMLGLSTVEYEWPLR